MIFHTYTYLYMSVYIYTLREGERFIRKESRLNGWLALDPPSSHSTTVQPALPSKRLDADLAREIRDWQSAVVRPGKRTGKQIQKALTARTHHFTGSCIDGFAKETHRWKKNSQCDLGYDLAAHDRLNGNVKQLPQKSQNSRRGHVPSEPNPQTVG